jgi:TRAP-type mannitol/chloroaromatic compound transport system permease small subunit
MVRRGVNILSEVCSGVGIWVSAGLLIYMVIHVNIEIILRSFFGSSTNSMSEFTGYAMGAMTYLSIAHTLKSRKHVRVSLIRALPGPKIAVTVELFCLTVTFIVFAFAAKNIWTILSRDFTRGSVSPTLMETPTWYIDAAIFTGLVFLLLQLFSSALDALFDGVADDAVKGD